MWAEETVGQNGEKTRMLGRNAGWDVRQRGDAIPFLKVPQYTPCVT